VLSTVEENVEVAEVCVFVEGGNSSRERGVSLDELLLLVVELGSVVHDENKTIIMSRYRWYVVVCIIGSLMWY
jgi:hypothetical protein